MPFKHKLACRLALLRDRGLSALAALLAAAIVVGCEPLPAPRPGTGVLFLGAGVITGCFQDDDQATATVLDRIGGTVLPVGDNAYPHGTDPNFSQCSDPTMGPQKARTRPSPGHHDYNTAEAAGYYRYFGANTGPADGGHYGYDLADWHDVRLGPVEELVYGLAPSRQFTRDTRAGAAWLNHVSVDHN